MSVRSPEPPPVVEHAPADVPPGAPADAPPRAVIVRRRAWFSWIWLVPIGALVAAAVLGYQAYAARGPVVTVVLAAGDGIGEGDPVTYRDVQVGRVRGVALAEGLTRVAVTIEFNPDAAGLAVEGTKFWIVRPEVSAARISGLDTLLGPRYIAVEPGSGPRADRFVGLARAPVLVPSDTPAADALTLVLQSPHRGSLSVGSPVSYRGIKVGAVTDVQMSYDARAVDISVAIDPSYAALVRSNTKFWKQSGIGADFGWWRGFSVRTGSLESVLAGGIELATPTRAGPPVPNGSKFILHDEPEADWYQWSPALLEPAPPGPG